MSAADKEVNGTDDSVYYAKTFEIKPSTSTEKCSVEINNVKNYAGIMIKEKYTDGYNPTANAKLCVAEAQTIDYLSIVTISAAPTSVSENYKLAIYLGSQKVAEGDNKSVSYEYGELKSDLNYTVKVVGENGDVQKDSSGNDLAEEGGKITCNAGFFKKTYRVLQRTLQITSES